MKARKLGACGMLAVLCSCGEGKFAEQYAARMAEVLKTYSERVQAKVRAEQQSYVDLAKVYDTAEQNGIQAQLDTQRNEAARAFSDDVQKAAQSTAPGNNFVWLSDVHAKLQQFAANDFTRKEAMLTHEVNAYKESIKDLSDLSVDQSNLNKLQQSLMALAKPRSVIEQLKVGAQLGCEVNNDFQLLEVQRELTDVQSQLNNSPDASTSASLVTQQAALKAQQTKLSTPCPKSK